MLRPSCVTAIVCAVLHAAISTGDRCGGESRSEHPLQSKTMSSIAGTLPLHQLQSYSASLAQLAPYAMCVGDGATIRLLWPGVMRSKVQTIDTDFPRSGYLVVHGEVSASQIIHKTLQKLRGTNPGIGIN